MSIPYQEKLWYCRGMQRQDSTACRTPLACNDAEWLARACGALSDPLRLRMLDLMAQGRECCGLSSAAAGAAGDTDPGGICVCELQEQLGLAQSRASYHLKVLREAGLVREETRGRWSFYHIDREAVDDALVRLRDLLLV